MKLSFCSYGISDLFVSLYKVLLCNSCVHVDGLLTKFEKELGVLFVCRQFHQQIS